MGRMAPPRALATLLLLALRPSVAAGGQVSATFANSGAGPLTIRWRRHDNTLAPGTEVAPGDSERIKTYGGHVWAVVVNAAGVFGPIAHIKDG